MNITEISLGGLASAYLLLIFPLGLILWYRLPILGQTLLAIVRMTLQLLLVGFYLQLVFRLNNYWLTGAWLLIMIGVADLSIIRGCGLKISRFTVPLFLALLVGAGLPLLFLVGPVLKKTFLMEAQYVIPIGGMILGNCLRANIIGIRNFYESLRKNQKSFQHILGQGARLPEAVRPFLRDAYQAALGPTIATIATIGLVALPGMMTGVILGGANPMTAIKYQIMIMLAIFSGTAITVMLAIKLTMKSSFTAWGVLDHRIFKS